MPVLADPPLEKDIEHLESLGNPKDKELLERAKLELEQLHEAEKLVH